MAKFTDSKGDQWDVSLNVGVLEKLATDADFDLDTLAEKPEAASAVLFKSPRKMAQILWVLCEVQAESRGIDPSAFGFRLDRPTLDRGTEAFLEAFVRFYPRSSAGAAIAGRLPEILKKMDAEIEARVKEHIDGTFSATATGSPESSGLTPPG